MRFEIETEERTGAKRVNIFPSDEHGVFVIEHDYRKQRAVGQIGLAGMQKDDVVRLEEGVDSLDRHFVARPDGLVTALTEGVSPVTTIEIEGSGNSVTTEITGFREMKSVPYLEM